MLSRVNSPVKETEVKGQGEIPRTANAAARMGNQIPRFFVFHKLSKGENYGVVP